MKLNYLLPSLVLALVLIFSSCVKDEGTLIIKHYSDAEYATMSKTINLPQKPYTYSIDFPEALWVNGRRSSFLEDDLSFAKPISPFTACQSSLVKRISARSPSESCPNGVRVRLIA